MGTETATLSSFERLIDTVRPLADTIWSNLAPLQGREGPARIMVTSVERQSGNTLISTACALGLARHTRELVTLIEANLLRPAVSNFLNLESGPGFGELLAGANPVEDCLRPMPGCSELTVLPAGAGRDPIRGEFAAKEAKEVLTSLFSKGRYVILDAPPLLESNGARTLLEHVDGVVLVLKSGSSRKDQVREATDIIQKAGVDMHGAVLNRFRSPLPFTGPA